MKLQRRISLVAMAALMVALAVGCEQPVLTVTVNSTADARDALPGNGVCEANAGAGNCTLRAAIDEANATTGLVQINVGGGTYLLSRFGVDDTNNTGDLDVTGRVSLVAQGAVTVNGGCTGDRVFDVLGGTGQLGITGMTVRGGSTSGDGGGVRANGTFTAGLSTITANAAGGDGGGVAVMGGTTTISSSTISGNQAGGSGGGVHVAAGATSNITISTLSGNLALPPVEDPCGPPPLGSPAGGGATVAADDAAVQTASGEIVPDPSRLIVQLEMAAPRARAGADLVAAQASAVDAVTTGFVDAIEANPATAGVEVTQTYSHLPLVVVDASAAEAAALAAQPGVVNVQPVTLSAPVLAQSLVRINADDVHAAGQTGSGTAVVIIDTGVDATEPMTSGKVIAEACFALGQDGVAGAGDCPGGASSSTAAGSGTNCPWFNGQSACWHGTHVASTAAGATRLISGVAHSGVAVGANLISVQVFSHFTDPAFCGAGITDCTLSYNTDQLSALNWVVTQTGTYNIASVNMSLGGGTNAAACDGDARKAPIDTLRAAGVATVIAAGNNGSKAGVGAPGCISTAITVGATDDVTDAIASFSQSAPILDMLAPGVNITAEYPTLPSDPGNDYIITANGTSMAAPHVAGAFAVLHAAAPGATVTDLENALESTGVPLTDTNALTRPRIDLQAAAAEAAGLGAGGGLSSAGTTTVTLTTISANNAWMGGGVHHLGGSLTIRGSIVASQAGGGNCAISGAGVITSGGYNLASDATCWPNGGTNLANSNPLLGALGNNGGATQTHLPAGGSPGRNVIPNGTAALCDTTSGSDQRGAVRPTGAACDMGSVET